MALKALVPADQATGEGRTRSNIGYLDSRAFAPRRHHIPSANGPRQQSPRCIVVIKRVTAV